jgi:hypothetical protein
LQNWIKILIKKWSFSKSLEMSDLNVPSTKTSMKKQNKQEFSPSRAHNSNNKTKSLFEVARQ